MNTEMRNDIFTQYQNVIWWVIKKNRTLFTALHLEDDDVFQDLSIAALKAIDGFDSRKSSSMFTHVVCKLQYEVLKIRDRQKPHGITGAKGERNISFTYMDIDVKGDYQPGIPTEAPFDEFELMEDIFSMFSACEENAVRAKMEGQLLRKKDQLDAMASAREKVRDYYGTVLKCAVGI